MARYEEALSMRPKKMKASLRSIELRKADNGGVIAEHRTGSFDGKDQVHAFGADEGHKLAAHIQEHMGITMPGKSEE